MKERKVGVILNYIVLFLSNAIGVIMAPLMIRFVGKGEYGLYSLIGSFVGYLTVLDFGLSNTIIRYVAKYREEKNKKEEENFIAISLIIYLVIAVLVILIGAGVYFKIDEIFISLTPNELEIAKQMFLILIINIAFTLPGQSFNGILLAYEEFTYPKLISILRIVIRLIACIMVLKLGYGVVGVVIVDTILNLIIVIINGFYVLKYLGINIQLHSFKIEFLIEILSFSFFIFLSMIVDQIYWRIDQTILGIMVGTVAVSIYAIAMTIVNGYISLSTAVSSVFISEMTRMVVNGEKNEKFTELLIRVGRIQLILLGYFLTAFIVLGKSFIVLWVGEDYLLTYYIVCIIIIPFTIPLIQNIAGNLVQIKNMHKYTTIIYIIIAVMNAFISTMFVKLFGIIGCALGTMLATIVGNILIINIFYYKKMQINMKDFYLKVFKGLLPALFIATLLGKLICNKIFNLNNLNWKLFIMSGIIFTLIYSIIISTIGMNKYEKSILIGIRRR